MPSPTTVWAPDPHTSIHTNWTAYRSAALEQGREPDGDEFAQLWWHKHPAPRD